MKNPVVKYILVILVTALILFGMSSGLAGVAERNAQAVSLATMQALLPGSTQFTVEPYDGEDANIVSVHKGENGFVVETRTYGYAGEITVLVGVAKDGRVTGLTVKDMEETLGLGSNALTDEGFLKQFLNTDGGIAIGVQADAFSGATGESSTETDTYVDGISGATVTSKAIARCVNSAVAYVTGADVSSGATSWGG